jgi:hypothetical protein
MAIGKTSEKQLKLRTKLHQGKVLGIGIYYRRDLLLPEIVWLVKESVP